MLQEPLRRLAVEAATRLTSLVASGEELPFDVAENDGEHTFYRYVPLTGRFVRAHADELRSLPAFGPACSAVDAAGAAAPYLEARGMEVPEDEIERAERMLIAFVARLWEGSAEFTVDKPRLEAALRELEVEVRDVSDAGVLLAPLVGLQMPIAGLELPSGVRIVRGDSIEAPEEARRSEGMNRSAWDPQFLAVAEQDPGAGSAAMHMLRELVSVMRLFKEGGVGLGPYAFTPTGDGTWKRFATGVTQPRLGGYRLSEAEAGELAQFARRLEARPDPDGSLSWAVGRFEMGCDRPTALAGLSDHLLAMRALFEGSGPVGANLPMRVAALIAEPAERPEAYEKLQSAFELERAMMAGGEFDLGSATGLAAWIEDATRAIVRGAALGEHGADVAASADESLVAAGLEAGEGSADQMGEADEWEPPADEEEIQVSDNRETEPVEDEPPEAVGDEPETSYEDGVYFEQGEEDEETSDSDQEEAEVKASVERDWLSEVSEAEDGETLEWPAPVPKQAELREEAGDEEPLAEPRVRHLFPAPENADWEVGELDYDRDESKVS